MAQQVFQLTAYTPAYSRVGLSEFVLKIPAENIDDEREDDDGIHEEQDPSGMVQVSGQTVFVGAALIEGYTKYHSIYSD